MQHFAIKRISALIAPILVIVVALACGTSASTRTAPKTIDFGEFEAFRSSTQQPTADCDQRCVNLRNEFAYVVNVGELIYAYWDMKTAETRTDFTQLARTFEASIVTETSLTQYASLLRRWAGAFHDGHVNAMLPADLSAFEIFTSPVRLEVLAPATDHERIIVSDAGGTAGAAIGDTLVAVNGTPARDALDAATAVSSGSTERMRRFFGARRLVDVIGTQNGGQPLVLTLLHQDGTRSDVNVPRTISLNPPVDPAAPAAPEATGLDLIKATLLPGQIGYLRIDGFSGTKDYDLLAQAMDRMIPAKALIIDLRKNGGGDQSGNVILQRLVQQATTRYKVSESVNPYVLSQRPEYAFQTYNDGDAFAQWHDLTFQPAPSNLSHAGKPVFAITSPNCFSACDTFAAALKSNGLAKIVGEATGGGTGTPLVFDLPHSTMQFRYSVVRGKTSNDDWIEGNGTTPDVVIEPTLAERVARKDQQLDAVIALALQAVAGGNPLPVARDGLAAPVTAMFGHPATQLSDLAPTVAEDQWIKRIAGRDEL